MPVVKRLARDTDHLLATSPASGDRGTGVGPALATGCRALSGPETGDLVLGLSQIQKSTFHAPRGTNPKVPVLPVIYLTC